MRDELGLSADVIGRLERFAVLLLEWNKTLNLIAARDIGVVWERHIDDSLQLTPLLPTDASRGVDLGTGGGFPGLVLALATGIPFDLIESDQRKAAFLRTAIRETGAPAVVHACRIEAADVSPARLVTARALAPLARLLPLAARFLTEDGMAVFLKGSRLDDELAEATRSWTMTTRRVPSRTHQGGTVLLVSGLRKHAPGG